MKSFMTASKAVSSQETLDAIKCNDTAKPIGEVCTSSNLDNFLENPDHELRVSYTCPETESTKYVSDKTTGIEMDSLDVQVNIPIHYKF